MKEYVSPELTLVIYEIDECLTGSADIPVEEENVDQFIDKL